jgi:hypothetical protein
MNLHAAINSFFVHVVNIIYFVSGCAATRRPLLDQQDLPPEFRPAGKIAGATPVHKQNM